MIINLAITAEYKIRGRYGAAVSKVIQVLVISSVTVAAANLSARIFRSYIQRSNLPLPGKRL